MEEDNKVYLRGSIIIYMEDTIENIQSQMGDISTLLDTINGEVV